MKIYLCGGIHGLSDQEANEWRRRAKMLLRDMSILDPMRRDYRGGEDENIDAFVQGDLREIAESDTLLVNATRPSWGNCDGDCLRSDPAPSDRSVRRLKRIDLSLASISLLSDQAFSRRGCRPH
jgi:hypothetical protein